MGVYILGIETSCDDTSAAVLHGNYVLSNVTAGQNVHKAYGGVVPELASRAHEQNIIPVVDQALKKAGKKLQDMSAIAYTRGPGLLGSLLVGSSFAKGLSVASGLPMIDVNHLHGHIFAHFLKNETNLSQPVPDFPFLNLLISGGHTQIIQVNDYFDFTVLGKTIDDAAGEAFDKSAKIMGIDYPGGPLIDKLSKDGDPHKYTFAKPRIPDLDFSFSGLKTSFLYFLRDQVKAKDKFIDEEKANLCASLQHTIVEILNEKLVKATEQTGIKNIAVSGGVSANSYLQHQLRLTAEIKHWHLYIPQLSYTTDNAAMIAIIGYYKYKKQMFAGHELTPKARMAVDYV